MNYNHHHWIMGATPGFHRLFLQFHVHTEIRLSVGELEEESMDHECGDLGTHIL